MTMSEENTNCPARLKESILHFAARGVMDIDGVGFALVDQLVSRGLVKSVADIYGLTLEQLAARAGIDVGVLSRFESGQAFNPTVSTLFRIAAALGRNLVLALDGLPAQPGQ